jgi:membrane protease YdiL (CAAX protease family)
MNRPQSKIILFLVLTIVFSTLVWGPLALGREPLFGGQGNALMLMWSPGLAAIVTRLVTQRDLRGMGWVPRTLPILALALILPLLYAAPVYLLAWGSGIGGFDAEAWGSAAELAALVGFGVLTGLIAATGEEIGWRGLLVPELAKLMRFRSLALLSGAIWASWHMPMMLMAGYQGQGTPLLFSLVCFFTMITALGAIMAWMTLRTRSFWPAALLHATHNLFVQTVFDRATDMKPATAWLTGEFGLGLVVTLAIAFALLWKFGGPVRTRADA